MASLDRFAEPQVRSSRDSNEAELVLRFQVHFLEQGIDGLSIFFSRTSL